MGEIAVSGFFVSDYCDYSEANRHSDRSDHSARNRGVAKENLITFYCFRDDLLSVLKVLISRETPSNRSDGRWIPAL
jgi:hypothetical protein